MEKPKLRILITMLQYLSQIVNFPPSQNAVSLLLILIVSITGVGCTTDNSRHESKQNTDNATNSQDKLEILNIAVIPAISKVKQEQQLKSLADYLQRKLSRQINFQVTKDYDTAVNLLVEEQVQIAYLGPLTYIKARKRNPQIQPILAPIEKSTGRPWYNSIIIVNSASNIKTIQDLKNKRFAFVSKSSTSGYLMPMISLLKAGIDPDTAFSKIIYSGSHDQAEIDLESGVVDAIADSSPSYLKQKKAGKLKEDKYKIIWQSQPIPMSPIVISNKLPSSLVINLKEALINAPEGLEDITGAESAGYTLVQDTDYEPIKILQDSLESTRNQTK